MTLSNMILRSRKDCIRFCPSTELFLVRTGKYGLEKTGKYGLEKTPYLDTFHVVII